MILSQFDFRIGDDRWISDCSDIFGKLYYRDIVNCIQILSAYIAFQVHRNVEQVHFAESENL
jgi:hypothetical protein